MVREKSGCLGGGFFPGYVDALPVDGEWGRFARAVVL